VRDPLPAAARDPLPAVVRDPLPAAVRDPLPAAVREPLPAVAAGLVALGARAEVTPTPKRGGFAPELPPF